MKLRYSSLKAALLGAALLFLSLKGTQVLVIDESFSMIVNLPAWLVALKAVVVPISAVLMAMFALLAVAARKQFVHAPMFVGYVVVLAYYFLRSAWLGSDFQSNLLAFLILSTFALAISLDFGTNRIRGSLSSGWMTPVSYFSHGYVIATFALWAAGYGYAQEGSRYLGMTYHPNAEGALAALCAGFFLARIVRPESGLKRRLIEYLLFGLALILVVASGSRAATLMALLAFVCLVRTRYALIAAIAAVVALYFVSGVPSSGADATIGGAVARMLSATTGNREGVWGRLISDFYAHPFLGVGDRSGVSGSGFLTAFAGDGMLGGCVFLAAFAMAIKKSVRLIIEFRRGRGWNPKLIAAVLMLEILLDSVFEGTLFDKFSPFPLLMMIFLLAISTKELDRSMVDVRRVP